MGVELTRAERQNDYVGDCTNKNESAFLEEPPRIRIKMRLF